MDDIDQRRLKRRFPALYRDIGKDGTTMFYGLTVGNGWFDLIWKLSEDLEKLDPALVASQVKEKFGTLRFYLVTSGQPMDERVRERIQLAEKQSACTCEQCGSPGKIYQGGGLYRHVACEPCEKRTRG